MKTELLILIPDSESFCKSKKSFLEFLNADDQISISGQKIALHHTEKSKELISAQIHVKSGTVKSKQERYFQIVLECENSDLLDVFNDLCNRIRSLVLRISPENTVVNTLWDDVGKIYAEKSYPLINEVENLMRKLIAEFMLITVGINWSEESMHPELVKKIDTSDDTDSDINDLYKLDFIHLNNVLFEKKRDINIEDMDRLLSKTEFSDTDKERLKKFIPKSNWEKHFSFLIQEKEDNLKKNWERLYKLRCKVAHNRYVKKSEYHEIAGLYSKIKSIIAKASEKLSEINLTEEDRESIIYTYKSSSPMANFIKSEEAIANYYLKSGYTVSPTSSCYDIEVDLIVEKDGIKIGVEIKNIVLSKITQMQISHLISRCESCLKKNNFSKIHIVFVISKDDSTGWDNSLNCLAIYGSVKKFNQIEIYFGFINEEGVFIPS